MDNGELRIRTELVDHECTLTAVLLRVNPDDPAQVERLDDAHLAADNVDAAELRTAWDSEILRQADFIREDVGDMAHEETIDPSELDQATLQAVETAVRGFSGAEPDVPRRELDAYREGRLDAFSAVVAMLARWQDE